MPPVKQLLCKCKNKEKEKEMFFIRKHNSDVFVSEFLENFKKYFFGTGNG